MTDPAAFPRAMARRTALGLPLLLAAPSLRAQPAWPAARPVRFVVGFPPGGSVDVLARTLSVPMSRALGQTITIDNRPGAGSNIGAAYVARSDPDGYTLLVSGSFQVANPALYRRLSYDTLTDFTPISRVTDLPTVICVKPEKGISTLGQLIARIRAEPGKWSYATPGNGTPSHLVGAMMAKAAGLEMLHVPFSGGAPSLTAVLAGDVDILIGTPPAALPSARAGRLVALAVTTRADSPAIPDVPGTARAGLPELDFAGWQAIWGPAGLPDAIRDRLFEATVAAARDPSVRERLQQEGLQTIPSESPAEFDRFIRAEMPVWAEAVRASGTTLD